MPVIKADKIMLYYGGSDWKHSGWRNGSLCLATVRPDGFAGYVQENMDQAGVIVTRPMAYDGGPLKLTADVASGGSIQVSLMDSNGELIAVCEPITTTITDKSLQFDNQFNEKTISLKIEIKKAKVYSFSIN